MTHLMESVIKSGSRAVATGRTHDLTDVRNRLWLYATVLHVIGAGSAARELSFRDPALSRLVQVRDKLAHIHEVDDIVPWYVVAFLRTRVAPAVARARRLQSLL